MHYPRSISATNPALRIFVLDQSVNMASPSPLSPTTTMADKATGLLNEVIADIAVHCVKGEDALSNRYYLTLIRYGGDSLTTGWPTLPQSGAIVSISEVADHPQSLTRSRVGVEDGRGGIVQVEYDIPSWVSSMSSGQAQQKAAFERAKEIAQLWLEKDISRSPPLVIHFTSGNQPNDGDPSPVISELCALRARDGPALLAQVILSSTPDAVICPSAASSLPADIDVRLYHNSSLFPESCVGYRQLQLTSASRMFFVNPCNLELVRHIALGRNS